MKRLPIWILTTLVAIIIAMFFGNSVGLNFSWIAGPGDGTLQLSAQGTANFTLYISEAQSVIGAKSSLLGIASGIAYWAFTTFLPRKKIALTMN